MPELSQESFSFLLVFLDEAYADFARRGFVPAREGTTEAPVTERTEETRARAATGS